MFHKILRSVLVEKTKVLGLQYSADSLIMIYVILIIVYNQQVTEREMGDLNRHRDTESDRPPETVGHILYCA